ncbi:MAG: hypothetical protein GY847_13930 [Proteobacteria bacterium]|nr:hypothetical protein [Pseudomonadota bacterium]
MTKTNIIAVYSSFLVLTVCIWSACSARSSDRAEDEDTNDEDTNSETDTDADSEADEDVDGGTDIDDGQSCSPNGAKECSKNKLMECQGGEWKTVAECSGETPTCDPELGCVFCIPGEKYCLGNYVALCNEDGTARDIVEDCGSDVPCEDGACKNTCIVMLEENSYLGCEFIAVSTANDELGSSFMGDFAVVIGNPKGERPARISVYRAGNVVATAIVEPGKSEAIVLPMVEELTRAKQTSILKEGAYLVSSTEPVVAYQYNPLHQTVGPEGWEVDAKTNDASLLLPLRALTKEYMVSTWPTNGKGLFFMNEGMWDFWSPGFVAIAGTRDDTEITIISSAITAKGNPGPLAPGETAKVTLNKGDVLQLFSERPPEEDDVSIHKCTDKGGQLVTKTLYLKPRTLEECETIQCMGFCSLPDADLTGTTITATEPVAVFSGHNCAHMPFDFRACDHMEEMLLPLDKWGNEIVMTAPLRQASLDVVATQYRILARKDGTDVTTTPEVISPVTLNAGEFFEFQSDSDFVVRATKEGSDGKDNPAQIFVTQALLGQEAMETGESDPAMGTGIPLFQSRPYYSFLVPETYTTNYINIVAPTGSEISVDSQPITDWEPITQSDFSVARIPIGPGSHLAEGDGEAQFIITAYGYGRFVSYLYPIGLDLEEFIPVE